MRLRTDYKKPILHLPDKKGRFQLYSDPSEFPTGSALYTKFKMVNQNLLHMQAKDCQKQPEIIQLQN